MSNFLNFAFGVILIIIWIVAGGYAAQASVFLRQFKDLDNNFGDAYTYTFWAAFVTFFLVALFILLVILSIVGVISIFGSGAGAGVAGARAASVAVSRARGVSSSSSLLDSSYFTIGFMIFAILLVSTNGVLCALAASRLKASDKYMDSNKDMKLSYDDCVIAAIISLVAVGLLILGIIGYFIISYRQSVIAAQEEAEEAAIIENLKDIKTAEAIQRRNELQDTIQQARVTQIRNAAAKKTATKKAPAKRKTTTKKKK